MNVVVVAAQADSPDQFDWYMGGPLVVEAESDFSRSDAAKSIDAEWYRIALQFRGLLVVAAHKSRDDIAFSLDRRCHAPLYVGESTIVWADSDPAFRIDDPITDFAHALTFKQNLVVGPLRPDD